MSVVLTLPTREELVVDLEAATTVGDLAREVEAQFGVSAFELSFNDEVLRDGKVALGDLGVADGDVLQVVVKKKVLARAQLKEMGYKIFLTEFCFRKLCREDDADVLALFYEADWFPYTSWGSDCFFPKQGESPRVVEYLLTFPESSGFLAQAAQQTVVNCLLEENLPLLKRLASLGVLKHSKAVKLQEVIRHLATDDPSDAALSDFISFIVSTKTTESSGHQMFYLLRWCSRISPDHAAGPLVQRVIPHLPKLYTASYLAAVAAGRFDWADLMLENPKTARVHLEKLPTSMTEREAEYFLRLINRGQVSSTSAAKYMRLLLQHPLDEVRMKVAVAVRLLVVDSALLYITKRVRSAENLSFLLEGVPDNEWRRRAVHVAVKRFHGMAAISDLTKMQETGMLKGLSASQLLELLLLGASQGRVACVQWSLPLCGDIPSKYNDTDPLYVAIKLKRIRCVRLLLEHVPQYSSWVYADGLTPLEFSVKAGALAMIFPSFPSS